MMFVFFVSVLFFMQKRTYIRGNIKEKWIYGCLMGLAALIGSLMIAEVNLPSFTSVLRPFLEPVGKAIMQ